MTDQTNWFEVDRKGLAKLLRRKGMQFVLYELVQNAWDTDATRADMSLVAVPGRALAELTIVDDDPNGFQDLAHAFTLFAESSRKVNPEQRGRFNLGEKLVLAVCEEAVISTTTGTVEFGQAGRTKRRAKRESGSEFRALLSLTRDEIREIEHAATLLIPPPGVVTTFNGKVIESRKPITEVTWTLPTEVAGADGVLKRTARKTRIQLYESLPGEPARIYEMGIPVCEVSSKHETGGWDANVAQKVPLNTDRDSVTAGYRRQIHVLVVNTMAKRIDTTQANEGWVRDAVSDERADPKAVEAVTIKRWGDKFVDYDPVDREANDTAAANGYAVIPSNALSKQERKHLRSSGALMSAGSKFPTQGAGVTGKLIDPANWTAGMKQVSDYAKALATALVGIKIKVEMYEAGQASTLASYGHSTMRFNVATLTPKWFTQGITWEVTSLVIHELAHHYESNHLSRAYTDAVCDLAAKFVHILHEDPNRFGPLKGYQRRV